MPQAKSSITLCLTFFISKQKTYPYLHNGTGKINRMLQSAFKMKSIDYLHYYFNSFGLWYPQFTQGWSTWGRELVRFIFSNLVL